MDQDNLLILGAGRFQVPVIEKARTLGFTTVVVSPEGDYPGLKIADIVYHADLRDKDAILRVARRERIRGVLTDQTDIPVPAVAYVAESLGLPGVPIDTAECITNKLCSRRRARDLGLPIPEFAPASSIQQARSVARELGYPLIVKPTDNQGSRGVHKVNSPGELDATFNASRVHSGEGLVLLESFCGGDKITVFGTLCSGAFEPVLSLEQEHFDLPDVFVVKSSLSPVSKPPSLLNEAIACTRRFFESFDVPFGVGFADLLIDGPNQRIWLIEAAIRGQGSLICSHLVPLLCGIDILEQVIEFAGGRRTEFDISAGFDETRPGGYHYFHLPSGVIRRIDGIEAVRSLPGVHTFVDHGLSVGRTTQLPADGVDRYGPILFSHKTPAGVAAIVASVQQTLTIEVQTADGVQGIRWL